jgi:hypothetical protein
VSWTAYDDRSKAQAEAAERENEAAALDEPDLSDATQARPKDVPPGVFDVVEAYHGKEARRAAEQQAVANLAQARSEDVPALSPQQVRDAATLARLTRPADPDWPGEDPDHFAPARQEDASCGVDAGGGILCVLAPGHHEDHEDEDGEKWSQKAMGAYVISDEEGLRRAFSAIRYARRRLEQNKRMQAPEVEALERELFMLKEANARANYALERTIEAKERAIEVYAQLHRKDVLGSEAPRKGEKKTRDYGIGRISYRAVGGEYRWRQDMTPKDAKEALARWALRQHSAMGADDERILVTEEKRYVPDREAIEEYVETLEGFTVPDGLEWVPESESITVKVGEEK